VVFVLTDLSKSIYVVHFQPYLLAAKQASTMLPLLEREHVRRS
jgi:hypothetical protein